MNSSNQRADNVFKIFLNVFNLSCLIYNSPRVRNLFFYGEDVMKCVVASMLLLSSLSSFAGAVTLEKSSLEGLSGERLPILKGSYSREVEFSTLTIPTRGSVVLSCEVKLPRYSSSTYSFYVSPRAGSFGPIEARFILKDAYIVRTIGSKIYSTNNQYQAAPNSTFFYITDVKQSNLATVVDLSNMPVGTTANCGF